MILSIYIREISKCTYARKLGEATMNDKKQLCPFCGSNVFERKEYAQEEKMALCQFSYQKIVDVCSKCGEEFDFSGENDRRFLQAYEKAKKASLSQMLKEFEAQKLSMAYIERALELSQRTLSQWKTQGTSAIGMALMRIIYTFPWLLKVADNKYDKSFANKQLVDEATTLIFDEKEKKIPPAPIIPPSSSDVNVTQNLTDRQETTNTNIVEDLKYDFAA